ncbi:MAG: zinc ABC transporter substrate-binding protein [Gemmatimonadota bacterium]|jgi:manganese/zinc/iron transport system substrate-binding protein|nr:zinc ABC transporter substrate-binding protein [Gemmatimonadota bacterium]
MVLITLATALAACGGAESTPADIASRPVRAVATTSIVADLVSRVGGPRVQLTTLMGPGVDPHLYRASEGDVRRMAEADIVFYTGHHLEGRMSRVLEVMGTTSSTPTVAVAEGIPPDQLLSPPAFQGAVDPHIWMDVSLWRSALHQVEDALISLDPSSAEGYRARAEAFDIQLQTLDSYVRERVATLSPDRRVLITAHDAFNYFGRAYGFEVRGLQGISTIAEAGAGDVRELATLVADHHIPALFVETSVSPRNIEAVRAAVRARGFEVRIGGNLYSDALGGVGSGADSYEGMIRHNVDTIVDALEGYD